MCLATQRQTNSKSNIALTFFRLKNASASQNPWERKTGSHFWSAILQPSEDHASLQFTHEGMPPQCFQDDVYKWKCVCVCARDYTARGSCSRCKSCSSDLKRPQLEKPRKWIPDTHTHRLLTKRVCELWSPSIAQVTAQSRQTCVSMWLMTHCWNRVTVKASTESNSPPTGVCLWTKSNISRLFPKNLREQTDGAHPNKNHVSVLHNAGGEILFYIYWDGIWKCALISVWPGYCFSVS